LDGIELLKVHRPQNKRMAQTREVFSGILRALLPTALPPAYANFLYTIYKRIVFPCVDML